MERNKPPAQKPPAAPLRIPASTHPHGVFYQWVLPPSLVLPGAPPRCLQGAKRGYRRRHGWSPRAGEGNQTVGLLSAPGPRSGPASIHSYRASIPQASLSSSVRASLKARAVPWWNRKWICQGSEDEDVKVILKDLGADPAIQYSFASLQTEWEEMLYIENTLPHI